MTHPLLDWLKFYRDIGVEDIRYAAAPRAGGAPKKTPPAKPAPPPAPTKPTTPAASVSIVREAPSKFSTGQSPPARPDSVGAASGERRSKAERLADGARRVAACVSCRLHEERTKTVYGVGNPDAALMFIGEGPGREEDLKGEPFVGRAGQLLTKIIEAMGLRRPDVYIANIVKCRPPENRAPLPDETATCHPFLDEQIEIIDPKIIVTLGSPSTHVILQEKTPITQARGRFREWRGRLVMPTFHPAFLLRNPPKKREVWEDMQKVMAKLKELGV